MNSITDNLLGYKNKVITFLFVQLNNSLMWLFSLY